MNIRVNRYRNPHRPVPVRETVVVYGKNADYCALSQLKSMAGRLDTGHLNQEVVSQTDILVLSSGRVNIQIPIVRRRL
jgi:hypothetical protein